MNVKSKKDRLVMLTVFVSRRQRDKMKSIGLDQGITAAQALRNILDAALVRIDARKR
jgi:hypothetical protein